MLLITTFGELRVVAGRGRTRTGRPHAVSERPMLIQICHAMPMPRCAVALRSRFQNGMVVAWHGRGMACVNQTRPHCVNQTGKIQSEPVAARHGMAWERHGTCDLALRGKSAAGRLLRVWVRIPPETWMFVCCVLSGRGLCDMLITRPEEFYRMWQV
jgi:hypothetical protein